MPRTLTPALEAAIAAGKVNPFYMAAIQFLSGPMYVWTGIGTITWNGHDWLGVGTLGGVSSIAQSSDVTAENITLTLSGIPSDMVSAAIGECRQNFSVEVWVGMMDDAGAIVLDPVRAFAGRMDVPTINDAGDSASISITAENPLVDLQRASERRYTHDDQQIDFPGDKGFQYVPAIQEWNGVWGKAGGQGGNSASGSGHKPGLLDPYYPGGVPKVNR
jgi:hypothetical protein